VGERESENAPPRSLDYFKPVGEYAPEFWEAYGERPQTITIVFPSDNVEQNCNERFELRQGKKLYAFGDGEKFEAWRPKQNAYATVRKTEHPNVMEVLAAEAGAQWHVVLTLRFLLLKINSVLGVWTFSTKAEASSIPEITSIYDVVKDKAGTVVGVPFDLHVEKVTSQKVGSKSSFPVIKMVPNMGVQHLEMVKQLVDSGTQIRGILSPEIIEKQVNALPAPQE